eukprot:3904188-Alexandrium_andersonii.AAC.1
MSASLVGSEMCIRDSGSSSGAGRLGGPVSLARHLFLLRSVAGSQRLRPVSYTHLTLPTICSV